MAMRYIGQSERLKDDNLGRCDAARSDNSYKAKAFPLFASSQGLGDFSRTRFSSRTMLAEY